MRFLIKRLGPWGWMLVALQAVLATRRHLRQTSPDDRARLQELLRSSGGRPGNLSAAERQEFIETGRRLRPGKLATDLVMNVIRPGRRAHRGDQG